MAKKQSPAELRKECDENAKMWEAMQEHISTMTGAHAEMLRSFFEDYLRVGFTEEQAMRFCIARIQSEGWRGSDEL